MALGTFTPIDVNSDTFSDWINKLNEIVTLVANDIVTANSSVANTDGDARINGMFIANTIVAADELRGGDDANSGTLTVSSNLTISNTADVLLVETDLDLNGDLHYTLNPNNYIDLVPNTNGNDLGNSSFRWDAFFGNVEIGSSGYLLPEANGVALGDADQRFDISATDVDVSANLTVSGGSSLQDTTATDLTVTANADVETLISNQAIIETITSTANLTITGNVDHTGGDVTFGQDIEVTGNTTINGTLIYTIDDSNYVDLVPTTTGDNLGNTTNRWDAFLNDVDVDGNMNAANVTVDTLTVTSEATLPSELSFGGNTTFENITVSNTANINNLSVFGLTTNTAAIIGQTASVNVATLEVIDSFTGTDSKGFKYMVHGVNGDASSTYAVEIMCAHNGTDIFFTRYAEVQNAFNVTLTPKVNGSLIELTATCPSAGGSNVHSFNIVRIETRDNT